MATTIVLPDGSTTVRSIEITDSSKFKVAKGGSIMQGKLGRRLLIADTIITLENKLLTRQEIEVHLQSGYLVRCSPDMREYDHYRKEISPDGEGELVEDAPGKSLPAPVPGINTSDDQGAITPAQAVQTGQGQNRPINKAVLSVDTGNPDAIKTSSQKIQPTVAESTLENPIIEQQKSRWNLDASTLADKSLPELSAMIAERLKGGETFEPFETTEEAIAFLSQDFSPTLAEAAIAESQ